MGGLLYQASKDNDSSSNFHSRCGSKRATVTIIETTAGNMLGVLLVSHGHQVQATPQAQMPSYSSWVLL